MHLIKEKHAEICDYALDFIANEFHDNFMDIYALTIAISEKHPEQVNNEVRNCLNHIARALRAETLDDARENLKKAAGHLERGRRDCLKLCIIYRREQIQSAIFRIEQTEGTIPSSLKRRLKTIEEARKQAFKEEARGSDDVSMLLESIIDQALDLEDQIHKQFNVPGKARSRLRRFMSRFFRSINSLLAAVIASLIASYLFAYFLPSGNKLGESLRDFWRFVFSPLQF